MLPQLKAVARFRTPSLFYATFTSQSEASAFLFGSLLPKFCILRKLRLGCGLGPCTETILVQTSRMLVFQRIAQLQQREANQMFEP